MLCWLKFLFRDYWSFSLAKIMISKFCFHINSSIGLLWCLELCVNSYISNFILFRLRLTLHFLRLRRFRTSCLWTLRRYKFFCYIPFPICWSNFYFVFRLMVVEAISVLLKIYNLRRKSILRWTTFSRVWLFMDYFLRVQVKLPLWLLFACSWFNSGWWLFWFYFHF